MRLKYAAVAAKSKCSFSCFFILRYRLYWNFVLCKWKFLNDLYPLALRTSRGRWLLQVERKRAEISANIQFIFNCCSFFPSNMAMSEISIQVTSFRKKAMKPWRCFRAFLGTVGRFLCFKERDHDGGGFIQSAATSLTEPSVCPATFAASRLFKCSFISIWSCWFLTSQWN